MAFQSKFDSDLGTFDTIIDVRSPAEFEHDHLPGSINLPALTNAQRAEVGTIYVQESRFEARKIGAAYVAANVARHLQGPLKDMPKDWAPLVYCWRGGQRSGSVTTILRQIGWQAEVLDGGYRSYRRAVQKALYDQPLSIRPVLLDGYTGTAKTALLERLSKLGVQTLNLEAFANHRGSLFGGHKDPQPSQKAFESAIWEALCGCDSNRPVVIEAESSKIGDRNIPPALWNCMCGAPRIVVDAPVAERARFTLNEYHDISQDAARLGQVLSALKPYHSAEKIAEWQTAHTMGDLENLVSGLLRDHYDPRYRKSSAASQEGAVRIEVAKLDPASLDKAAGEVLDLIQTAASSTSGER